MKKLLRKIISGIFAAIAWLSKCPLMRSDRVAHLAVCFFGSIFFGYGFGLGAGIAAEYKDKAWGGQWDWWDLAADGIGTLLGGIIHHSLTR